MRAEGPDWGSIASIINQCVVVSPFVSAGGRQLRRTAQELVHRMGVRPLRA